MSRSARFGFDEGRTRSRRRCDLQHRQRKLFGRTTRHEEQSPIGRWSLDARLTVEGLLLTYPARQYRFCLHLGVAGLQVGEFMLKMMLGLALLLAVCVAAGLMLRLPPPSDDDEPRGRR